MRVGDLVPRLPTLRLGNDDVVYVPPMPVFYIYGEVRQPGSYPLAKGMTVRQALSVGGGLTAQSDPQREYEETWHKATGLLKAVDNGS